MVVKAFYLVDTLPLAACQLGWIAAEVGVSLDCLWTAEDGTAQSINVSAGEILFSIILFGIVYLLLGGLYIYLLVREVKHGPQRANV